MPEYKGNANDAETAQDHAETDLNDTLERLVGIVTRRRWWVLLPACGIALATITALAFVPNRYTSEATVLVVQQQVPERYVTPTSTTDISQVLQGMTQEVLSRTRLLSIIDSLDLYAKDKGRLAPEVLIERMRRDIQIQPLESNPERRTVNAFKIAYSSDTPQRAQEVTSRLTSLFIEENLKTRARQATVTNTFLQEQLEAAKKQLAEQEERVRRFKMQYLGELPEQQASNGQILASLSSQLDNTMAALNRAREQRVYLESLLNGYRDLAAHGTTLPGNPGVSSRTGPAEAVRDQLATLQSEREALLSVYTSAHPDVRKKDQEIAKAKELLRHLTPSSPVQTQSGATPEPRREGIEQNASLAQVKSQLEANRLEIENLSKDAAQLKGAITRYQERLNATPVREQQLAAVLRDYELQKQNYADLLSKGLQSQLAMSLEKEQGGQQFRLVDAPSLPSVPSSPKRMKISFGGAAAGVFLGFALAFLIDTTDRSFHTEKEIIQQIRVPVALAVPLMLTAAEERRRRWKTVLEWCGASVLLLAVAAAEFYVYRRG